MTVHYFLGLDYSTQQLKSLLYDGNGDLINEEIVVFDVDLKHYGTVNGVFIRDNGVVNAPSSIWIEATDILFERLSKKINLSKIAVLSGSAQQHTSMFWTVGASKRISNFDPYRLLGIQIFEIFSLPLSPTWMDSSTTEECMILENLFGGKQSFQTRIGSSLANRFTGPQILKAFKNDDTLDSRTESITLVSNGMCSIFSGVFIGMDVSDAAGTGLQKCGSLNWDSNICSAISNTLQTKLGRIIESNSVVGYLSDYFVKRYNMNPQCQVVAFTGDNPSSVVGLQLSDHDLCLSMGTSDTLFSCLTTIPVTVPDIPIFVFPHPLTPGTFVTLICYKNGSRVRQQVCQQFCDDDWSQFSQCLKDTAPGNEGLLGLFYDDAEITPPGIQGRRFFNYRTNTYVNEKDLSPPQLVRSLIEGQLLTKYSHFSAVSSREDTVSMSKLLVTGGASANREILQVASDIFNVPLYSVNIVNSAALGSVIRAVNATSCVDFSSKFTEKVTKLQEICQPRNNSAYKCLGANFFDVFKFLDF